MALNDDQQSPPQRTGYHVAVREEAERDVLVSLFAAGAADGLPDAHDLAVLDERGEHTGSSPVDRGKPGSKMHVLSDANGLPLVVGVSAGDTHDSEGLKPMVAAHQTRHDPPRGRYFNPRRLHADKAYDRQDLRNWLRGKGIGVRIARKGIESGERLGRRRWVIERTMSWLSGYRRLSPRCERNPRNYLAFLGLAAAMCCYKRLVHLTT